MYNVGLRKKRYILPGKLYEEKNTVFACFKTYVNYLYRSVLSSNGIISYIAQTQHFRESQIPKDQNWSSRCDKFVFQKVYLFKHVSQLLPSIWSVLLEYLQHFYVIIFYGVFFEICVFVCFCFWPCCCFAVVFVLFSFVFISGQNFSSSNKDAAVTTAAVELNIRTISVQVRDTGQRPGGHGPPHSFT